MEMTSQKLNEALEQLSKRLSNKFDPRKVSSYFRIAHEEFNDVLLNECTVVGGMGAGKSELVNYIAYRIMKDNPQHKHLFLLTRDFKLLFELHKRHYREIRKMVQNADVITIHIDDALSSLHTHKHQKTLEIRYAEIRHYFRTLRATCDEDSLFCVMHDKTKCNKPATINVFFSTQRYQQLAPMMREGGVFIAKAIDLNPTHDPRNFFLNFLGPEYISWLRRNAFRVKILRDKEAMCWYLLKAVGAPPGIFKFKPAPDVGWIELVKDTWLTHRREIEKTATGRARQFLDAVNELYNEE